MSKRRSHIVVTWASVWLVVVLVAGIALGVVPAQASFGSTVPSTNQPAPSSPGTQLVGVPTQTSAAAVVNFEALARQEASRPVPSGPAVPQVIPSPGTIIEEGAPIFGLLSPMAPSPAATISYVGLDDIAKIGASSIIIPPDTDGAVGLTKVMEGLNNNYRIQDKATGATLSTVSIDTFWAASHRKRLFRSQDAVRSNQQPLAHRRSVK